jgi:hypothetical protein
VRRLLATALFVLAACSGGERWSYVTPAVVDEAALLAHLRPAQPGELVLANFWASW